MKKGLWSKMAGLREGPSTPMRVRASRRKAPSKEAFHRDQGFQSVGKEERGMGREGTEKGREEGGGGRKAHEADNSGLRIRFLCLGRQTGSFIKMAQGLGR